MLFKDGIFLGSMKVPVDFFKTRIFNWKESKKPKTCSDVSGWSCDKGTCHRMDRTGRRQLCQCHSSRPNTNTSPFLPFLLQHESSKPLPTPLSPQAPRPDLSITSRGLPLSFPSAGIHSLNKACMEQLLVGTEHRKRSRQIHPSAGCQDLLD